MPTRSGYIHGSSTAVPDSDYVIDISAVFNAVAPDTGSGDSGGISLVFSIADSNNPRYFVGDDDPHEFILHEPHLYEPNTDSEWYGGYGFSTSFGESDLSTNITLVRPALEVELDSAQANGGSGGGGGASQDDLDSANSLIVTLRDDVDSAETLISTLRSDLDSAEANIGTSGPVQRWVT